MNDDFEFDGTWHLCTRAATDFFEEGQIYIGIKDKATGETGLLTCQGPVYGATLSSFTIIPPEHLDKYDDSQFDGKSKKLVGPPVMEKDCGKKEDSSIKALCVAFGDFLQTKNERYGNSVGAPVKIFSKSDIDNSFYVRMDDKLSRIANRPEGAPPRENDLVDLAGYIILLLHQRGVTSLDHHID